MASERAGQQFASPQKEFYAQIDVHRRRGCNGWVDPELHGEGEKGMFGALGELPYNSTKNIKTAPPLMDGHNCRMCARTRGYVGRRLLSISVLVKDRTRWLCQLAWGACLQYNAFLGSLSCYLLSCPHADKVLLRSPEVD